jgi:tetratricopeptide (TPR) repeat protein
MPKSDPHIKISKGRVLSLAERYLERGLYYFGRQKYDDALLDFDDAIDAEPRNAELYVARGLTLVEAGFDDEAEEDLAEALRLNPKQWAAHYVRALIAYKRGELEQALIHLDVARVTAPERPEIYIYQAAIYYHQKNKAKAEEAITKAQETIDKDERKLKMAANKWQKAIEDLAAPAPPP